MSLVRPFSEAENVKKARPERMAESMRQAARTLSASPPSSTHNGLTAPKPPCRTFPVMPIAISIGPPIDAQMHLLRIIFLLLQRVAPFYRQQATAKQGKHERDVCCSTTARVELFVHFAEHALRRTVFFSWQKIFLCNVPTRDGQDFRYLRSQYRFQTVRRISQNMPHAPMCPPCKGAAEHEQHRPRTNMRKILQYF